MGKALSGEVSCIGTGLVCLALTLLHSEWSKLHRVLAVLSAIGLSLKAGLTCTENAYCNTGDYEASLYAIHAFDR